MIERYESVAWDGLVMRIGKWLMHQWEKVSLSSPGNKKGKGRPKIALLEVI